MIKQGNSIVFTITIKDEIIKLEDMDAIRVLVTSPGIHNAVVSGDDIHIIDNKICFELTPEDTRHFKDYVKIEVSLHKGDRTIIGTKHKSINVEHTYISKL